MIKSNKNKKKKKGFTLVELIAVIAIIGILAAILIPSIGGYITKAKKTKVIEQSRQFTMAVESTIADGKFTGVTTAAQKDAVTLTTATAIPAFNELVGIDATNTVAKVFPKLPVGTTYAEAVKIAAGATFTVDQAGVYTVGSAS